MRLQWPGRWTQWGLLALLAVAFAVVLASNPGPDVSMTSSTQGSPAATVNVSRTTLLDTRTETGTLGYGDSIGVPFISRARTGIVTWMAPEGAVVARGEPLFAIDGQPVILFYGELPFFRTLRFDSEGSIEEFEWLELINARDDQRQAELNLALQRARLAEAEVRLEDARTHKLDSSRDQPVTPQFVRLTEAVATALQRLQRVERLAESNFVSDEDLQKVRYDVAAAKAELDAAKRERTQQFAAAETTVAGARLAIVEAERALRDASDVLDALLSSARDNADIELLRENLLALSFEDPQAKTVRHWQAAAGRSATGLIEPGQIVVSDGPVRVAEHMVDVGDIVFGGRDGQSGFAPSNNSSDLIMRYTGTDRNVTVPLEISDHAYARVGNEVVVTLPTGLGVSGVIADVSSVFDAQGLADAVIEIPEQAMLGTLETASVEVEFIIGRVDNVLAVPVAALLALSEGGFAIEIVDGDASCLVPVTTGLFARGSVEIDGADIAEGMLVRIPR